MPQLRLRLPARMSPLFAEFLIPKNTSPAYRPPSIARNPKKNGRVGDWHAYWG